MAAPVSTPWVADCFTACALPTVRLHRVAGLFGHVRETNYGRWFDVRSVVGPTNLANSSLGLAAHTDNPYRDPVPTLQLLHCIESTAAGGENLPGRRVAYRRTGTHRAAGRLCAALSAWRRVPVSRRHGRPARRPQPSSMSTAPERSRRALQPDGSMQRPSMPAGGVRHWYDAYLLFARLLAEPDSRSVSASTQVTSSSSTTARVLHGRTAFEPTSGTRHLQGCYADIDGLRSTIAVLSRAVLSRDVTRELRRRRDRRHVRRPGGRPTSASRCRSPSTCCKPGCRSPRRCPANLVVAALLHDFGHLVHTMATTRRIMVSTPSMRRSAHAGCRRPSQTDVTVPIRLHVAAKRYLCANSRRLLDRVVARVRAQL